MEDRIIKVEFVSSEQPADLLTKALERTKFESYKAKLNLKTIEDIQQFILIESTN